MRRFNMADIKTLDLKNWQIGLPYMDVSSYLDKLYAPKTAFPYIQNAVRLYNTKANPSIKKWLEEYRLSTNVILSLVIKSNIKYNVDGFVEFLEKFVEVDKYISADFIRNHEIKIFETDLIWDQIYDGVQLVKKSDVIMGSELDNFIQFIEQIYDIFNKNNIRYINIS
jgi:hypothetical protein